MGGSQPVLVLGLGKSGRAVVQFFLDVDIPVHGVDDNANLFDNNVDIASLQERGAFLYPSNAIDLASFRFIVISPGIPHTHPIIVKALQLGVNIVGEIELACGFLKKSPLLAITGTNGKTTVTLLVNHILNSCGLSAKALGNVGVPLISEVPHMQKIKSILVVELSSYQLETLSSSVIDAAIILNITPDHLDRYSSMEDYAKTKFRIGHCLKPEGVCYIEEKTLFRYKHLITQDLLPKSYGFSPNCDLYTDGRQVFINQLPVFELPEPYRHRKNHEVENLLAAYALCHRMGVTGDQFIKGLATFVKPPHRIEFVREYKGIKFFDDSKGTNIDAVIRAVETLYDESPQAKILLIAGGVDKGAPYAPWKDVFQKNVRAIYVIGQAAKKMKEELEQTFPVHICASLEEATRKAAQEAVQGEYVLLSPGCSSYDMFRDYAHRGEEFKKIVKNL